jgi:hypothetical protein
VAADAGTDPAPTPRTEPASRSGRPHLRRTVIAIIVVATVVGFFAAFAVWVKRQALETDTWTHTSTELLANPAVQTAVAGFLVDTLYKNVDVEGELERALPPRLKPLAGPAAGGLREVADRVALEALQRPVVQELWAKANGAAHGAFLKLIEGGGAALSTTNGDVTLNLGTIATQVGNRVGVDVSSKIPASAASIVLIHSDQLSLAQKLVKALKALSILLPLVMLALFALAIYLARGWRRRALRACGFSLIVIGVLILVARSLAGDAVVNSLASTEAVKPAVDAVWSIATSLLRDEGVALIGYGVVVVIGAWLAGETGIARDLRREITPILRARPYGYAVLALIVILAFVWSPTEGTRRLIPALALIVLLVVGFEALRRQAIGDFPDATLEAASERWHQRLVGVGAWARSRRPRRADGGAAPGGGGGEDARLERLERLARLRDSGVLDDDEIRAEKARIMASS